MNNNKILRIKHTLIYLRKGLHISDRLQSIYCMHNSDTLPCDLVRPKPNILNTSSPVVINHFIGN